MTEILISTTTSGQKLIDIPVIFYWENETAGVMTAAFKWGGSNYGLSYPLQENNARRHLDKKQLVTNVRGTLDVMLHHGKEILGRDGNLNGKKVKDAEAIRFFRDSNWANQVVFMDSILKNNLKNITIEEAKKLKLL